MTASNDLNRRIFDLFEAALEQPEDRREQWVREQAVDDMDLLSGVLSMLNHDKANGEVVQTGGAFHADGMGPMPERIGAYKIVDIIGQGGMGIVYEGRRDAGDFEHRVAIKVTRPGLVSSTLRDRFENERNILASLSHPGIAKLFDGGATETGAPFMVMEFVEGAPIVSWADQQKLDLTARLHLFRQVLEATRHAHQNLIIHRDITPSNVLVTDDGTAKLIDFGIAKPQSADDVKSYDPASLDSLTLTPGFAAPERLLGAPANILFDVYALGGLLSVLTRSQTQPSDLKAIIKKATADNPADRYASADAMLQDLNACLEGRPVSAVGESALYRFNRFFSRHRLSVTSAAAAILALIAGLITTTSLYQAAETARSEADQRFNDVRSLANYMLFDLDNQLAPVAGTLDARRSIADESRSYLDALSQTSRRDANLEIEAIQSYHKLAQVMGSPTTRNLGRKEDSAKLMDATYDRLTAYLKTYPEDPRGYKAMAQLAYDMSVKSLYFDSDPDAAALYLDETIASWDRYASIKPLTPQETSQRYDHIILGMDVFIEGGQADMAIERLEALEPEMIALRDDNPGVELHEFDLAGYYVALGRDLNWKFYFDKVSTEPALIPMNKGIELYEELNARPDRERDYGYMLAVAYYYRGQIYSEISDHTQAIIDMERAEAIAAAHLEKEPESGSFITLLDGLYKQKLYDLAVAGRDEDAKRLISKVETASLSALEENPNQSISYAELGNTYVMIADAFKQLGDQALFCDYINKGAEMVDVLETRFNIDATTQAATVDPVNEGLAACAG